MAVKSSGPISFTDLVAEFADTAPHSINEFYRGGGKVPDAPINSNVPTSNEVSMGDFYNAAARVPVDITYSSPAQNVDLWSVASASPSYIAGISDVTVTIDSGQNIGAATTLGYAFSVPAAFDSGDTINIVNNGTIIGAGGAGGRGYVGSGYPVNYYPASGSSGGNALYVNFPITVTNNGTIAGGGGGGGGGGGSGAYGVSGHGGGGAGFTSGAGATYPGALTNPVYLPAKGSDGTVTAGGSGGSGVQVDNYAGGAGGGQGAAGSAGAPAGGGYVFIPSASGGSAGSYVVGNSNVTWAATGTRLGSAS